MITNWRKSARSANNATCVEVGWSENRVGYRDSKQAGQGPVLVFGKRAGGAFLALIKNLER
ncbi:DUF397 domain-containing protein [Actinosynnema sp. CS-041913]|uniref:DUF397 domain-containing protein n=1 Tax=Actinosynnema sp. CS-041913 TaxID=3239917 RepID=UPI003D8EF3D6